MPHLDEGALWVRATLPYTISYEEASKFAPQVRALIAKYPQVTEVGSELGRPDDGTDPTGFFNCEFYVGLKPYKDPSWEKSSVHDKPALIADLQKQLEAFPGVIFNYTQPAEDAVDEALTGLKSALAVKIYGPDLNVLQDESSRDQTANSRQVPRIHGTDRCARTRPAEPSHQRESRQDRALRRERGGRGRRDSGRGRRTSGNAGDPGRKAVRPRGAHEAGVSRKRAADRQSAGGNAGRPADSAFVAHRYSGSDRRVVHLSRKQLALHRRAIQHRGPGFGKHRKRRAARRGRNRKITAARLPDRHGAANTANFSKRSSSSR